MQNSFLARCVVIAVALASLAGHAGALSVGDKTACAIQSDDGRLRCWGKGQATVNPHVDDYYPADLGDLKVPPELHTNTFDVVVMKSHVCALKADALDATMGKLKCFKAGNETILDLGPTTLAFKGPGGAAPDLAATNFVQLSGKGENVCALDETGQFSCWSEAAFGAGASWGDAWGDAASKRYKSIAVGYDHMCVIAICSGDEFHAWECFGPGSLITNATENDAADGSPERDKIPAKYNHSAGVGSNSDQILKAVPLKSISCGKGVRDPLACLCYLASQNLSLFPSPLPPRCHRPFPVVLFFFSVHVWY
jgi:hypothetical protein